MLLQTPNSLAEFALLEGEGLASTIGGVVVHVGNERLARRVLAESAKAKGELQSTPQLEADAAGGEHRAASRGPLEALAVQA